MNTNTMAKARIRTPANDLGTLLRYWRAARRKSQMQVSLDARVSQRHLSFIEIGRSAPSRETLIGIAEALDIPFRDRNSLLLAAGYAPQYEEVRWDEKEHRSVTAALKRMLRQHEPYPAIVLDRYWNVLDTNSAAPLFFGNFVDLAARRQPRNLLHLMFDPAGMRPFIANWEEVAPTLLQRAHRESVGGVMDQKLHDLISEVLHYPGAKPEWRTPRTKLTPASMPIIPISFSKDGQTLSYFSMLTTLAAPQTVSTQEVRIESMFPLDEATEILHARMMNTAP